MTPKVSDNGLGLDDLMIDHEEDRVLLIPSPSTVLLTINDARNVPTPGLPGKVVSRFVRIGTFSQRQVVSNVFTIPCDDTDVMESPHWTVRQSSFNISVPKDCLIARANPATINPCILFELCVKIKPFNLNSINAKKRMSEIASAPEEEYSCAWGLVPICGPDGKAIEAKSYEVKLYSGSPGNMDFLPTDRDKVKHGKQSKD